VLQHEGDPSRRAVILPGVRYLSQAPLLWFAREAAAGAEYVVVIGKSLGSSAASLVTGPAIWLTPLLDRDEIVAALESAAAPTLLVGSPADPTWGDGRVPENPSLQVLELEGLDHSLQVSGDPLASLDVLRRVTERVDAFVGALA
jgi:hypothetical protein